MFSVKKSRKAHVFSVSERKGLLALLIKAAKQKGIAVGALFAIVFNLLFALFVSDVRIEGLENISEPSFREKLREAGLEVGSLWHAIDKNNLEAQLLDENKDIAWLTVNRKGTVAYVKVIESTENNDVTDKELVGNIVAD